MSWFDVALSASKAVLYMSPSTGPAGAIVSAPAAVLVA